MKKFKKIIVTLLVFGVGSFISFAKADTFDYSDALLAEIRSAVRDSASVRSKPEGPVRERAIFDICEKRIESLKGMIDSPVSGSIEVTINRYLQKCGILMGRFEHNQLRRSTTPTELRHNADAIRTAYIRLKDEVVENAPKGFVLRDSGEEEVKCSRSKKRYMTTRENRRGYQGKRGRK